MSAIVTTPIGGPPGDEISAFRDVESVDGDSRPGSPIPNETETKGSLDGTLMTPASAGPEAVVSSTIRAHSVEQKAAFDQAIRFKNEAAELAGQAEKAWKAEPLYNFTQRATLYKAYVKAQVTFKTQGALVHLEQSKATYLDVLSKSSLPLDEQHALYSKFQKAIDTARGDRTYANHTEAYVSLEPYQGSSTRVAEAAKQATESEQAVQKLLKDIQKPHAESRHAIAQVLRYREVQWHQTTDKSSDEALQLKADIDLISSFEAAGGLSSLTTDDADRLNGLFKDASSKHATLTKLNKTLKETSSATSPPAGIKDDIAKAKLAFEAADKVVMNEIVRLRDRHALKNNLTSNIAFRNYQLSALPQGEETRQKRLELLKPKELILQFLDSGRLHSLTREEVNGLNDLFQIAGEKHNLLEKMRSAPADSASPITEEELDQANKAFEEADAATIAKIKELLDSVPQPPIPSEDISLSSAEAAAKIPLPEEEGKSTPAKSATPVPTSSSAASGAAPSSLSLADVVALKNFATKMSSSLSGQLHSAALDDKSRAEKAIQLGKVVKLLKLFADPLPSAKKIEALRPLVDLAKKIEEKNEERDAARTENPTAVPSIIEARTQLESTFLVELQNLFPLT